MDYDTNSETDTIVADQPPASPPEDALNASNNAAEQSPEAVPPPPAKTLLSLQLLGADPIKGLSAKIKLDGKEQSAQTDGDGYLPDIEAEAGTTFELAVQCLDGSYKTIDQSTVPSGSCVRWQYLSPSPVVVEVTPDVHEGEPGQAEAAIPQPTTQDQGEQLAAAALPSDVDATVNASTSPAPTAAPTQTATPPARPAPAQTSASPKPTAARVPPHISGKPPVSAATQQRTQARDANGHPLTVLTTKVRDWWNTWHLPALHLLGHATPSASTAPGAGKSKPAAPAAPQAISGSTTKGLTTRLKVPYTPDMPAKVQALVDFATEQTTYDYGKAGSAAVAQTMLNGTFKHTKDERTMPEFGGGQCYQYVRLALLRARITDKLLAAASPVEVQASASRAGPALLAEGFKDVTDEVPDPRWAAAGDVIVYEWSTKTWEQRRKDKKSQSMPNHGHIDIRSIDRYISDFIPPEKMGYHPKWTREDKTETTKFRPEYVNIGIYRKYYDPLPTCRIRAFLRCLKEFECQGIKEEDRYRVLNKPLPNNPKSGFFSGYAKHPWADVPDDQRGKATAAGAYQILYSTWKEVMDQRYFDDLAGKDLFSPQAQDRMAVLKIEQRKALILLRQGNIQGVVNLLKGEWVSLPGGTQNAHRKTAAGRPMDIDYLMDIFGKYLAEEKSVYGMK